MTGQFQKRQVTLQMFRFYAPFSAQASVSAAVHKSSQTIFVISEHHMYLFHELLYRDGQLWN